MSQWIRHGQKLDAESVLILRHLVWKKGMTYRAAAEKIGFPDLSWKCLWKAVRGMTWRRVGGPMGGTYGRKYSNTSVCKRAKKEGRH